jgi:hypothetical protein
MTKVTVVVEHFHYKPLVLKIATPQHRSWCVLQLVKKESVIAVQRAFCTQFHKEPCSQVPKIRAESVQNLAFANAPFLLKFLVPGINGYSAGWFHVKLCVKCMFHSCYTLFFTNCRTHQLLHCGVSISVAVPPWNRRNKLFPSRNFISILINDYI